MIRRMPVSSALASALANGLAREVAPAPAAAVHGGSISECYRWETERGPVFVKRMDADRQWILDAERDGLERLAAAGAVRVPAVLAVGAAGDGAFLALEWLELRRPDAAADARLGAALAGLHDCRADRFGLPRDNALGATSQGNAPDGDWPRFWGERRLRPQLELAARNGHRGSLQESGRRLLDAVPRFFAGHQPEPSLLHGDLWSGNRAMLADGTPVIFDPAVYYGDAEADLAMTTLFGRFAPGFYRAYASRRPAAPGAAVRADLYNVYHVLNHLNLFGGGYRAQAEAMIDRLLAVAGR